MMILESLGPAQLNSTKTTQITQKTQDTRFIKKRGHTVEARAASRECAKSVAASECLLLGARMLIFALV